MTIPHAQSLQELVNRMANDSEARLPNYQLIESKPSTIYGIPAHILGYKYSNANHNSLQQMAVITLKDGNAYVLGLVAEQSKYASYLPIAQYMIDTFEAGPFAPDNLPLLLFSSE